MFTSYTTNFKIEPVHKEYEIGNELYYYNALLDNTDKLERLKTIRKWNVEDINFSCNEWITWYKIKYWKEKYHYDIVSKKDIIWNKDQTRKYIHNLIADYFFDSDLWDLIWENIWKKLKNIFTFN